MDNIIEIIKEKYSEFNDSEFVINEYGWDNTVVFADDTTIFRIPRKKEDNSRFMNEMKILNKLSSLLKTKIPEYKYYSYEEPVFGGYDIIKGVPLSKEIFETLNDDEKMKLAVHLSSFLNELHEINPSVCFDTLPGKEDIKNNWKDFRSEILEKLTDYFDEPTKKNISELFDNFLFNESNFDYKPVIIHGDLSDDHIIFDDEKRCFSGIIDFEDIMINDPAYDFIGIYMAYGEEFYNLVLAGYKHPGKESFIDRIKSFYIKRTPFYSLLHDI